MSISFNKAEYYCFFCSKEIVKLTGCSSNSLCVHHINGNHNDDRPSNRANAHIGCHHRYHDEQMWTNLEYRQSITRAVTESNINRRLQMCRLCGHDVQEDLKIPVGNGCQHTRTLIHHLQECHLNEIPANINGSIWTIKLSNYFMSRIEAKQLLLAMESQ